MDLNPRPRPGLYTDLINQLHQTLQQESVSREFHAFCHLCPPEAPAATELGKLDEQALLEWIRNAKKGSTSGAVALAIMKLLLMLLVELLVALVSLRWYVLSFLRAPSIVILSYVNLCS